MFRGNELVSRVEEQALEIKRLESEVERLDRLQVSGPAAAIAQTVDDTITAWANNGYADTVDPETGFPAITYEAAYGAGIQKAIQQRVGEVLKDLKPAQKLELITRTVPEETLREAAKTGLASLVEKQPEEVVEKYLSPEDIKEFVMRLTDSEEVRTALLEKLAVRELDETTVEDLQREFDNYGYFSTDRLPEGARIKVGMNIGGDKSIVQAIVQKASDETRWMAFIDSKGGSNLYRLNLTPRKLFRLGYIDDEGKTIEKIMPDTPFMVMFHSKAQPINAIQAYGLKLTSFMINNDQLNLKSKTTQ